MSCETFKCFSILLTYPEQLWVSAIDEIFNVIDKEHVLNKSQHDKVMSLKEYFSQTPLLSLQESYVAWFDRTPPLSLYLFEHVYGESRDRGQAMVDLQQRYDSVGLLLKDNELPDFIPVFLEYLSRFDMNEARSLLSEPINILTVLSLRLKQHHCCYHIIIDALLSLSKTRADPAVIENAMAKTSEHDKDALDKSWQEPEAFPGVVPQVRREL